MSSDKTDFVLHIGANKTGSSAIQNFMRLNVQKFSDLGYDIPDRKLSKATGVTGEHVFALEDMFRRNDKSGLLKKFGELKDWAGDKTVLMSAENLSNLGRSDYFDEIGKKYTLKVVLYIRRQDELLTSSWQQWFSKVEQDFQAWLVLALQRIGHWERIVKAWEEICGKDNMRVRIFDRTEFLDGDIMTDFLDCLDLADKRDDFSYETGKQINPSYTDVITPLVSGNRAIFQDANDSEFYKMVGDLTQEYYSKGKKVSLMSRAQRETVVQFFHVQNERIRREYFPDRTRLFKVVDHSKYDYFSKDEMHEQQLRFLTHVVHGLYQKINQPN